MNSFARLPVAVYIHGGGWSHGDLNDQSISPPRCENNSTIACWLAQHGVVVFSINYTLVDTVAAAADLSATAPKVVAANSHFFTAEDIGSALIVQESSASPWSPGGYQIVAVANGSAMLNAPPSPQAASRGAYSLIRKATLWPAQWQDCDCFLKYLAENLGVNLPGDPQNIYLMGHSAGAHLAAITGLGGPLNRGSAFQPNCDHASANYTVRAIAAASPPTDLVTMYAETATAKSNVRNLLGCIPGLDGCNTVAASASITSYVGHNLPAYMAVSGGSDDTVPPENVHEAQAAFENLQPPVGSQWINLGPGFFHDLDVFYYSPCSSAPEIGGEPSPCGSAGSFFAYALDFFHRSKHILPR